MTFKMVPSIIIIRVRLYYISAWKKFTFKLWFSLDNISIYYTEVS